ncbi:hypothetical protein RHMOL_Rhmol09G0034900 [Rhododendron molle]|nr:hypothetical protein RHMOL_Rhmol09G0034900 [Rhododendron molle]
MSAAVGVQTKSRTSVYCVGNCWHLGYVNPVGVAQRLLRGLQRYFIGNAPTAWILLAHGHRIWPVEVANHQLW